MQANGKENDNTSSVEAQQQQPQPCCKHWARTGSCFYGEKCRFAHPADVIPTGRRRIVERHRLETKNDPSSFFRRWLIDTFGREELSQGTGVIDVAGGKGQLSFELVNLNKIPSTVVDPRPLRLDQFGRRIFLGMHHRNDEFVRYVDIPNPTKTTATATAKAENENEKCDGSRLVLERPWHIPSRFLTRLFISSEEEKEDEVNGTTWIPVEGSEEEALPCGAALYEHELQMSRCVEWGSEGLQFNNKVQEEKEQAKDASLAPMDRQLFFEHNRSDAVAFGGQLLPRYTDYNTAILQHIAQGSSVIVGLHADQAVAAIVDVALHFNKSFAVVPCCVFGKSFPKRHLKTQHNKCVTSYEDLCQFIEEKSPEIQKAVLPIEGRNVVYYRRAARKKGE